MLDTSVPEPLLGEAAPRSARCGGKALALLAMVVSFGLVALASQGLAPVPAVDMAWQPVMQARPSQSVRPVGAWPVAQQPLRAFPGPAVEPRPAGSPLGVQGTLLGGGGGPAAGLRTNALPKFAPPAGPGALPGPSSALADLRQSLGSAPAPKCVWADKHASVCGNFVVLRPDTALRATTNKQTSEAESVIQEYIDKFNEIENKPQKALIAGGATVALIFSNGILGTIDSIPILPKLFELVGAGYTGWFTYRYLLNAGTRKELIADIEEVKKRITDES